MKKPKLTPTEKWANDPQRILNGMQVPALFANSFMVTAMPESIRITYGEAYNPTPSGPPHLEVRGAVAMSRQDAHALIGQLVKSLAMTLPVPE